MRQYKFDKPLVESSIPPKSTDVYWVDIDEHTGKLLWIKEFNNGEWIEVVADGGEIVDTNVLKCINIESDEHDFWGDEEHQQMPFIVTLGTTTISEFSSQMNHYLTSQASGMANIVLEGTAELVLNSFYKFIDNNIEAPGEIKAAMKDFLSRNVHDICLVNRGMPLWDQAKDLFNNGFSKMTNYYSGIDFVPFTQDPSIYGVFQGTIFSGDLTKAWEELVDIIGTDYAFFAYSYFLMQPILVSFGTVSSTNRDASNDIMHAVIYKFTD